LRTRGRILRRYRSCVGKSFDRNESCCGECDCLPEWVPNIPCTAQRTTAQVASNTANMVNRQCHSYGLFVSFPIEACLRLKKLGDLTWKLSRGMSFPAWRAAREAARNENGIFMSISRSNHVLLHWAYQ